jgi:hypothetical protein
MNTGTAGSVVNCLAGKQDLAATLNSLSQSLRMAAAKHAHEHSGDVMETTQQPEGSEGLKSAAMPPAATVQQMNTASGKSLGNLSEQDQMDMVSAFCLVAAWSEAISAYSATAVDLLEQHRGYLCKVRPV